MDNKNYTFYFMYVANYDSKKALFDVSYNR